VEVLSAELKLADESKVIGDGREFYTDDAAFQ